MIDDYKKCKLKNIVFREIDGRVECMLNQTGVCATYPLLPSTFERKAKAVLMDLDGTTVKSEEFWIYLIEKTIKTISNNERFSFVQEDIPYVSGFSTVEHLSYALKKYGIKCELPTANAVYHVIAERELKEILYGRGNVSAFKPREGLKDFLYTLKSAGVKIGLVTSGLDYKAIPEIVSTFRLLDMGDPLDFYDAVITGGKRKIKGQYGTLGELSVKPHPWVYAEIGMSLAGTDKSHVITLEDSASGLISSRLAGYSVIGFDDGNIEESGLKSMCFDFASDFDRVLKDIL